MLLVSNSALHYIAIIVNELHFITFIDHFAELKQAYCTHAIDTIGVMPIIYTSILHECIVELRQILECTLDNHRY